YSSARAFVFPGLEDFGITPLEAMAAGCPVLAYGRGGATETVIDGVSGLLFESQTASALKECVQRVERREITFEEPRVRGRAQEFSKAQFQRRLLSVVERTCRRAERQPLFNALVQHTSSAGS